MLLRNDADKKLVNGSKGILVGFVSRDEAITSCDRGPKGRSRPSGCSIKTPAC
jgi:hypothetical protein